MVSVVTMSANTAAYAAEAIKPSQRMRGDAQVEDAIALLALEKKASAEAVRGVAAALRRPTSLSLMLMNSNGHLPQSTTQHAIDRYLENSDEVEPVEGRHQSHDENADARHEDGGQDQPDEPADVAAGN